MKTEPTKGIKALQRKVQARQKFVEMFLKFAHDLLLKVGERTRYDQKDWHTHTTYELHHFRGFSFLGDFGQTQFGGNTIHIWRTSKKKESKGALVFRVYSQCFDPNDYRVETFDEGGAWQCALLRIMKNKERCIAKFTATQKKEDQKERFQDETEKRMTKLLKDSNRLGLHIDE